jgi:hypothetical protein
MRAKPTIVLGISLLFVSWSSGNSAQTSARRPTVKGGLMDQGKPISDAEIILQSFEDEKCAKLFLDKKPNAKKVAKLQACTKDQPPIRPNDEGAFEFDDLSPGWYNLRFLWNIREKPSQWISMTKDQQFAILYAGHKDETGRYDTMAQSRPFEFSGKQDVVIRFSLP